MGVLSRYVCVTDYGSDKLSIRLRIGKRKVLRMPGRITRVFDRYEWSLSVLLVQESRQAKHPVTVRASGVSAKRTREYFEHAFLLLKREAFDPPKHLVFAGGCCDDRSRNRDRIRRAKSGESRIPIGVEIEVQIPDLGDAFLGPLPASRSQWIGGDIDVRPARVFM